MIITAIEITTTKKQRTLKNIKLSISIAICKDVKSLENLTFFFFEQQWLWQIAIKVYRLKRILTSKKHCANGKNHPDFRIFGYTMKGGERKKRRICVFCR